jgi:organic hydroperoxide reductase OsmC/OhrA
MHIRADRYDRSIEINIPYYKYTIKHEQHPYTSPYWRLSRVVEDFCLHSAENRGKALWSRKIPTAHFSSGTSSSGNPRFEEHCPLQDTRTFEIGNPPVFKGTPDVWCPEDLLIGALNACLMLTFLYQMQRRQLEVVAYESSAQGTLEHRDGKHRVTRILVQPRISLKSGDDVEAAREAIKDTVDACMISNSILAAVQVDPQFNALLKPAS